MVQEDRLERRTILVVDDVEANRSVLDLALRSTYNIDFARHGQEALEKIALNEYDLVILDIKMPILDGIETLRIIRQSADPTTLPVILASAIDDYATIVHGLELGANDYITKPLDRHVVKARVKTQITLKQTMDERNQAIGLLERMMEIASHDLKNPLANLSLIINLLKSSQFEGGVPANFLDMASESISVMLDIINDFLGGSNLSSDYASAQKHHLSGELLLDAVINQYRIQANNKHIKIIKENIEDATIVADPKRTGQVISNLLSNAIKYSPCHGSVHIRAFHTETMWRLEIQDTGPGIPEDEKRYLFQAFSKKYISTTPTNGEASTGLGLWIAYEMMRVQHGRIGMENPDEGGCCFWIEIPTVRIDEEHLDSIDFMM